jgi:hypothetical protein
MILNLISDTHYLLTYLHNAQGQVTFNNVGIHGPTVVYSYLTNPVCYAY